MPLNEREMFDRIEIGLDTYYKTNNLDKGSQIQVELFIDWLYNQYGLIRKGVKHEGLDTIQKLGS